MGLKSKDYIAIYYPSAEADGKKTVIKPVISIALRLNLMPPRLKQTAREPVIKLVISTAFRLHRMMLEERQWKKFILLRHILHGNI